MAADSIALLTSINGTLINILHTMSPQNENSRTQQTVLRENRGGLDPSNINPPKPKANASTLTINGGDIKVSDLVAALNGIPEPVKEIAGLNNKVITDFSNVLTSIVNAMVDMTKSANDPARLKASADFLKSIQGVSESVKSIAKLSFILPFALTGAKLLTPFFKEIAKSTNVDINEKSGKALIDITKSLTGISSVVIKTSLLWPVMPFAILGAKSLSPFFKSLATAANIEITEDNIKSLTYLSKVIDLMSNIADKKVKVTNYDLSSAKNIKLLFESLANAVDIKIQNDSVKLLDELFGLAENISKLDKKSFKVSKSTMNNVKKLKPFFTELVQSVSDINISEKDLKKVEQLIITFDKIDVLIKTTAKVMPVLPLAVLSAKMIKPFIKSLAESADIKITEEQVKNVSLLIEAMSKINTVITKTALITPIMPIALLGAVMIKPFFKLLGGMCSYVGGLENIDKGIANVKKMETFANTIIKFAVVGAVMTAATLGLGILVKDNFSTMLTGLGAVSAVLIGYTAVATLAGIAGKYVQANQIWFNTIIKFAALGVGLVITSAIIGGVVEKVWDKVLYGMGSISATILLVAGIAALLNTVKTPTIQGIKDMMYVEGLFVASAGLIIVGAILGGVVEKVWDKVLIGTGAMTAMLGIMVGIAAAISATKIPAQTAIKDMLLVEGLFAASAGLIIVAAILGGVVEQTWDKVLIGTGSMTAMMGIIIGISAAIKAAGVPSKTAVKDLAIIERLYASTAVLLITAAIIGKQVKENWDDVLIGVGSMTTMMGLIIGLATAIKAAGVPSKTAIKNLAFIEGLVAGSAVIVSAVIGVNALRKATGTEWSDIFITIGAMTTIIGLTFGLSAAVNAAGTPSKTAIRNIAFIEGLVAGSAVILAGVIGLHVLKEKANAGWDDIFIMLGSMGTIITGVGALAVIASKLPNLKSGAVSLLLVDAVAAGAVAVLAGIIGLQSLKNDANIEWSDIFITMGAMATILVGIGAIATAAGALVEFIAPGVLALAGVELIAAGSVLVLSKVVDLVKSKNDAGIEWNDIFISLGAMGTMIAGIGAIATAAGLVSPFIALGTIALAGIIGITSLTIDVANSLINLQKSLSDNNLNTDSLTTTLKGVTGLFTKENLDFKLSLIDIAKLDAKYLAIIPVIKSLSLATTVVSKMVDSLGNMDENGKIRPVLKIDENGVPTYGKSVDVQKVTHIITDSLVYFASQLSNTFKDLDTKSIVRLNLAMLTLRNMIDPVSKFAEMLGSFESAGNNKIRIIKYNDKGELINTPFVDVKTVANIIAKSISTFGEVLFSKKNIDGWMKNITQTDSKWPFAKSTAEKAMGVLGKIITPVSNFAQTLSMFEAGGENELVINEYGSDGKITSTKRINVTSVATNIANAITKFATILFIDHADEWKTISGGNKGKVLGIFGKNNTEKGIGVFSSIIEPVNNFVNILTQFTGENGEIGIIESDGKVRKINISNIATQIATSINTFVTKLTTIFANEDQLDKFKNNTSEIIDAINSFSTSLSNIKSIDNKNLFGNADTVQAYLTKLSGMSGTDLTSLTSFTGSLQSFNKELEKCGISKDVRKLIENNIDLIEDILDAFEPISKYNWDNVTKASISITAVINDLQKIGNVKFTFVDDFGNMTDKLITSFEKFEDINWNDFGKMTNNINKYINALQRVKTFDMQSFNDFIQAIHTLNSIKTSPTDIFIDIIKSLNKFETSLKDNIKQVDVLISDFDTARTCVVKLNTSLNDLTSVLSNIDYPTDGQLLSITNLAKNVVNLIKSVGDTASDTRTKKVNNFAKAIQTTTSGMKKFDELMEQGKKNRKNNLESFGNAIEGLKKKLDGLGENLTVLKDTVQVVSNADAGRIEQTANALGKLTSSTSSSGGNGSGISYNTLVKAIKDALSGVSVETSVTQGTGTPAHTTTGDRSADAIISVLSDLFNQNIDINTTLNVSN